MLNSSMIRKDLTMSICGYGLETLTQSFEKTELSAPWQYCTTNRQLRTDNTNKFFTSR